MIKKQSDIRAKRGNIIRLLIFCLCYTVAAQNAGDEIFGNLRIIEFRFDFEQPDYLDLLYQSQADKEYIAGNVEVNGTPFDSIGVRFKGFSSFWGYPGDKKSFRIKFNKYKEHSFNGLKKINLNNGWSDPTLLREKLYLDFLNQHDIPAPRANFARVYINDIYWGFYSLVEHVDKVFLNGRFAENDGNLYKAEKLADLSYKSIHQEDYYEHYALKTNEKVNDWGALLYLIDRINNVRDNEFDTTLESILNVPNFTKAWAANNLFINLDSYLGSANNYYLYYNEEQSQFNWIIWDVNLAFGARAGIDTLDIFFNPGNRPLIKRLLADESFRENYIDILGNLLSEFSKPSMISQIDTLYEFIKEDYFADSLKMYSNDEIVINLVDDIGNIPGLKKFIISRKENVSNQLELSTYQRNKSDNSAIPSKFKLSQNYPNPFNPATIISWQLAASSNVELTIYNQLGEKVSTPVSEQQLPGRYQIEWHAIGYASGVYYYQLCAGKFVKRKKMLLLR